MIILRLIAMLTMAGSVWYFLSKRASFWKVYFLLLIDDASATGHAVTKTNFC